MLLACFEQQGKKVCEVCMGSLVTMKEVFLMVLVLECYLFVSGQIIGVSERVS